MTAPAGQLRASLVDALVAGAITAALALPFVALKTDIAPGGLAITTRWPAFGAAVLLVFFGRLGLRLIGQGQWIAGLALSLGIALAGGVIDWPGGFLQFGAFVIAAILAIRALWERFGERLRQGAGRLSARAPARERIVWWVSAAAIAIAVLLPFLIELFPDKDHRRLMDLAILIMLYLLLAWGLNIVVGLAGLLDLGFVAFYAIGAYSFALLNIHYGLDFWVALPLAGVFAALGGLLLGFPVLRLRGDYFAIVTLGFGEIIRLILINWTEFTRGADGIRQIPRPSFFGMAEFDRRPDEGVTAFHQLFGLEFSTLHRIIFLYYIVLVLALLVNFFTVRLRRMPIGRAWEALREDDIAAEAMGIDRVRIKLAAFMLSATWGGFAGAFFATRQGFISPESFTFIESAIILAIVVLGGMGSQLGILLATLLLIGLPEFFRELEEYRMLAFGAGMVLVMIWRPRGLLAHREPTVRLGPG